MTTLRVQHLARALPLVAAALFLSSCTVITGPDGRLGREQRALDRAWDRWASRLTDDYEFVVRRNCYCGLGGVNVRVEVRNGFVVAREIELSGVGLPPSMAPYYPSIDGLFQVVQRAIDRRAWSIDASYDATWGFPTDVWIDYDRHAIDEEEGYQLIRFRDLR